jgi:hypothetical protein
VHERFYEIGSPAGLRDFERYLDACEHRPFLAIIVLVPPTFGNGKICYVEIPATDIARSADFYRVRLRLEIRNQ